MVKTTVINETGTDITLEEGSEGVHTLVGTLKQLDQFQIHLDPRGSRRQYVAVVHSCPHVKVLVTSDDCIDHQTVRIVREASTNFGWEGIARKRPKPTLVKGAVSAQLRRWFTKLNPSQKKDLKGTSLSVSGSSDQLSTANSNDSSNSV